MWIFAYLGGNWVGVCSSVPPLAISDSPAWSGTLSYTIKLYCQTATIEHNLEYNYDKIFRRGGLHKLSQDSYQEQMFFDDIRALSVDSV